MSGDVVALPGLGPISLPDSLGPVKDVVSKLEEFLEEARVGKIRAIGFAIVRSNGMTGTAFAMSDDEAVSHQMTAATAYLHHRYIAHKLGKD